MARAVVIVRLSRPLPLETATDHPRFVVLHCYWSVVGSERVIERVRVCLAQVEQVRAEVLWRILGRRLCDTVHRIQEIKITKPLDRC